MREAFAFYEFVKTNGSINGAQRFLDFGCGWGPVYAPIHARF